MKTLSMEDYRARYPDRTGELPEDLRLLEIQPDGIRLPKRNPVSHKYSYGRALIIAGSTGYSGAPVLAANACERGGAGLTQLVVPESVYAIAASRCDGAVVTPVPASEAGGIRSEALRQILSLLGKAAACAIGPGLGINQDTRELTECVIREATCPLILDADALTVCGRHREWLSACRAPLILTPHEGEFRRLGGDLTKGRLAAARTFTAEFPQTILVLKGYGTLVCAGEEISVNPTGSPAMAKGGSGDVLTGLLCALLAQGFDLLFSARCAVYLHGLAGDLARAELGEYSVTPSDLIRFLPSAIQRLC
ncbi:MAG: NAD(P)H-hydrate dehydratase [Oscillospiraceae bacterium]|nr:NAD(P)H-hydrate dehydratase [Oscillospiraceae bacterium]